MKKTTPTGFPDILPDKARQKEDIVSKIAEVYRRYGFVPLETPIVEFQDTLVDEQTDFNLFHVHSSKERQSGEAEAIAMRFDLTVPLARVVAQYSELLKPFKRYQLGTVFRGERPQKGRYRQFSQLDADIVGSSSVFADIEIITMMREVMYSLEVSAFTIRVNTRNILNALPVYANFSFDKLRDVLVILDKRDKVSREELATMLKQELSLETETIEKLIVFGEIKGTPQEVLEKLETLFATTSEAKKGLQELYSLSRALDLQENKDKNIIFDMSIIRGLAYYTGLVFETVLDDLPEFGSVYSGGRYDELIGKYLDGKQSVPAVGASVGVDRLLAAFKELEEKGLKQEVPAQGSIVLVQDDAVLEYAFLVATHLRSKGIICDLYLGKDASLGKQFSYAESKRYERAYIVGKNEQEKSTVIVKELITRTQSEISFDDC